MLRSSAFMLMVLVVLSSMSAMAEPACLDKFNAALTEFDIEGTRKIRSRNSNEIKRKLDEFYQTRKTIKWEKGQLFVDALANSDSSDLMIQNARNENDAAIQKAADTDPAYVRAGQAAQELINSSQFDAWANYLHGKHAPFQRVLLVGDESAPKATAYIAGNRVTAYRIHQGNISMMTVFAEGTCDPEAVLVGNLSGSGPDEYILTPRFCSKKSDLEGFLEKLKNTRPTLSEICREQGGSGSPCQCPGSERKLINPRIETCLPQRQLNAQERLQEFINGTGAAVDSTKNGVRQALTQCEKFKLSTTTAEASVAPNPSESAESTEREALR